MRAGRPTWFTERFTPYESHRHGIRTSLVNTRTRYQKVILADTYSFGRCLILDGEVQSAELDEYLYHEALVHPAAVLVGRPRHALILGGGEGATLRELFRYRTLKEAVMVDIDGEVVRFCKKYLARWHRGAFSDPRCRLVIQDARRFVEETRERFDLIYSDLPTPIYGGPASRLYTVEFYRLLKKRLARGGVLALQAGSGSLLQIKLHTTLARTLSRVFRVVRSYQVFVPSFDVPWAFLLATDGADPMSLTVSEVDRRLRREGVRGLRFYDGEAHVGLVHLPRHLRNLISRERRVITTGRPVYFYK